MSACLALSSTSVTHSATGYKHSTCCARGLTSSAFSVQDFPYLEAILEWLSAKKRRAIV